jgi:hypothetical protein
MSELAATAERLRVVKDACIDFMTLWALDRLMAEDRLSDRICGDLLNAPQISEDGGSLTLFSGRYLDD